MDSYQFYYDFQIGSENAGYYTVTIEQDHIAMLAKFALDDEIHKN